MKLLELLQGRGAADAPWWVPAAFLGAAAFLWIAGGAVERTLVRRRRTAVALGVGLVARSMALVLGVRTLPLLAGVDLPWISGMDWGAVLTALAVTAVGMLAVTRLANWAERTAEASGQPHRGLVAAKGIRYGGAVLVALLVTESLGWDLTTLLATAGVAGVAVGFAAQTSLSNVIAGVFLLVDRPFEVGDVVEITGQQGVVLEITLMSTRVRTFDNLVVRWPNEVVLKERIVNFAEHPVRRVDALVRLPVDAPLEVVLPALARAAAEAAPALLVPAPEAHVRDLDANGATVVVWAWADRTEFVATRDALWLAVQGALRDLGLAARVPQYTTLVSARGEEAATGYLARPEDG